jgi:hypothetical protein
MSSGSNDSLEGLSPIELVGLVRQLIGEVERLPGENEKVNETVAALRLENQQLKGLHPAATAARDVLQ